MRTALGLGLLLALAAGAPAATTDAGIAGRSLVLRDGARADSVLFVATGREIDKGPAPAAGDAAGLSATLDVFHSDDSCALRGRWRLPAPWARNRGATAAFANPDAPGGPTTVRSARIRTGKMVRILARGLGDDRLADLSAGAPSDAGGVTVVLTLRNAVDGSVRRMCTRFAKADGGSVRFRESKRGRRLVARGGVAVPCPAAALRTTPPDPAVCEGLNAASCLLPYPSSRFLVPAATPTGVAVRIPQAGLPRVIGTPVPASNFDGLDGFSPAVQILSNFPQGVDVARSNASRLLPAGCCGQPGGPPWIDTRTHTARSLDADSPTILLDAETGERILHWVETDARATDPARQLLFLRPGRILDYDRRYIVAMRNLVTPTCEPVVPEAAFAAIRDGDPADPALEARREHLDTQVLDVLEAAGIPREDLVLAFDFRTGSEEAGTKVMLSMRDQAYAWLDAVVADPAATPFTVESVTEHDCSQPGAVAWRNVAGRFDAPLFLEGDLDDATAPFPALDASGLPVQNGFHRARFFASIPCSLLRGTPAQAVLFGHGIFQEGKFFTDLVPGVVNQVVPWTAVAMATDWRGLSSLDVGWVPTKVIGLGASQLHDFPAFPGRLRQGLLNTLVLARMMKEGIFNRDPAFRLPDDRGALPGPATDLGYYGVSLGGIMGTYLAALTPDIERFGLAVGAVNFSCMLQRATPFSPFDALLSGIGITDPLDAALGIQLTHEFWFSGEPASVAHRITANPLPGAGPPKKILYTGAWLDHQVSNQCTEIAARTMRLPMLEGSVQRQVAGIPDASGPEDSGLIYYHLGELDLFDPAHAEDIPPLANRIVDGQCDPHPRQPGVPAGIRQLTTFLAGGQLASFCDGACDGATAGEQTVLGVCDPTS